MLNKENLEYYYKEIKEIFRADGLNFKNVIKLHSFLKEIIVLLTKEEEQIFPSHFARLVFVIDKHSIGSKLASLLRQTFYFSKNLKKKREEQLEHIALLNVKVIVNLCYFFTKHKPDAEIQSICKKYDDGHLRIAKKEKNRINIFNASIRRIISSEKSIGFDFLSEEFGSFQLYLNSKFYYLSKITKKGNLLNLIGVIKAEKSKTVYFTDPNSIIVLEPDILLDITEIAESVDFNFSFQISFFIKLFSKKDLSKELLLGSLINSLFDELLLNQNADFESAYDEALKVKPLSFFAIALQSKNNASYLKEKTQNQFEILKKQINKFNLTKFYIEPSFVSPIFGIQGRLDLLIEDPEDEHRKDLVELKSGKAPQKEIFYKNEDGKMVSTGCWSNHITQATGYNLLLDSIDEKRAGSSLILYSSDLDAPLRNVPNHFFLKQDFLKIRNLLIHHYELLETELPLFFDRKFVRSENIPKYTREAYFELLNRYESSNETLKEYLFEFTSFISKEIKIGKLGKDAGSGNHSAPWESSIEEKRLNNSLLANLKLNRELSNLSQLHLTFDIEGEEENNSIFRKGDLVVLYKEYGKAEANPNIQQLFKSSIRFIDNRQLTISLRNKHIPADFFEEDATFILEGDTMESAAKALYSSVFELLSASEEKQQLLLGESQPQFDKIEKDLFPNLYKNQRDIIAKAVAAQDYYLIQGPPGTGKTSVILKNIVNHLFHNSADNILLLAYTNRAVDEICTQLKKIDENFPFLRLGYKDNSNHLDRNISFIAESMDLRELFLLIKNTKVFVSTVSSALSNCEVFQIKKFNIAIIDEASQILEPHLIGLLCRVERFIMIGDEKQLPAVVLQNRKNCEVKSELLKNIELHNLSDSLFERLLKIAKSKKWNCYDLIKRQARMHKDIQELTNFLFYNNQIKLWRENPALSKSNTFFSKNSENFLESQLSSSRLIFINTKTENRAKANNAEARLIIEIIDLIRAKLGADFKEKSIGVVCMFRAQVSNVLKMLNQDLKENILVDTVERFQGSERDFIIISSAVHNSHYIQFVQSVVDIDGCKVDRKLNVAISRARRQLIFLGNEDVLSKSEIYKKMIDFIKEKGGFLDFQDY